MNETIEKLKEIGLPTLHEKTHVSMKSLEHIINKRFDAIHHIQFNGFLNIIENELHIDMTPLRNALKEHRVNTGQVVDDRQIFVESPNEIKNKKPFLYIVMGLVVVALVFFLLSDNEKPVKNYKDAIQSSAVEDAKLHLESKDSTTPADFQENSANEDSVSSFQHAIVPQKAKAVNENHPFVIYPKESLWIGVVNIDTDEQKDTITSEPYPLDETANLLITLGHGYLKVDLNGQIEDLSERKRVRFLYKNGKLSRITAREFKELNKGNSW